MRKKIILTVISLLIVAITLFLFKTVENKNDTTIFVEIIKEEEILKKEINYSGITFYEAIEEEFDLEVSSGFIYKIDFLECYDMNEAYIMIMVNDKYSNYGIEKLNVSDQDKVSFIYTKI